LNPVVRLSVLAAVLLALIACGPEFERTAPEARAESGGAQPSTAARDPAPRADAGAVTPSRDPHAGLDLGGLPVGHPPPTGGTLSGPVLQTMDASNYTYVQVDTARGPIWAAAPRFAVGVGARGRFPTHMPMADFRSTSLQRTFDMVYFADAVEVLEPASAREALGLDGEGGASGAAPAETPAAADAAEVEPAEGGLTIAEAFADAASLEGEAVTVRGRVVKWNAAILGRNWLHVRDGTGEPGANDLTVTTDDVAAVGDVVLVRGTLARDRDFGAGYVYDLIVEDARVVVE